MYVCNNVLHIKKAGWRSRFLPILAVTVVVQIKKKNQYQGCTNWQTYKYTTLIVYGFGCENMT